VRSPVQLLHSESERDRYAEEFTDRFLHRREYKRIARGLSINDALHESVVDLVTSVRARAPINIMEIIHRIISY